VKPLQFSPFEIEATRFPATANRDAFIALPMIRGGCFRLAWES